MKIYARHGDVAFIKAKKLPKKGLKKKEDQTVALGEATGHHHTFQGGAAVMINPLVKDFGRTVEIEEPTEIHHQEHKPIPFEPGAYVIRHQRIFSDVGISKVLD